MLETDTGNKGFGETIEKAVAALKENAPAVVYLETAKYLLISPDATEQAELFYSYLKPSVKVCVCQADGRVKDMAEYLEIQRNLPRLKNFSKK